MKRTKENQDSFIVVDAFGNTSDQMLFSVCDGHGPMGAHASAFVTRHLPASWDTKQLQKEPFLAMNQGCLRTNQELSVSGIDVYVSGTTCIASYLKGNVLHVANVGDSRAVLGRMEGGGTIRAIDLSHDQKPDRPDEMARIVASGGRVFEWGVPRVWLKDADMPGLAMARSFGDLAAETVGVYAEPELARVELGEQDKFAIWGSDGIWEFISSQEAVDIVAERGSMGPQACCDALVKESTKRWNQEEDVVDDTTVIVAFFGFGVAAASTAARRPPVKRAGSQRLFTDNDDEEDGVSGAIAVGSGGGARAGTGDMEVASVDSDGNDLGEERPANKTHGAKGTSARASPGRRRG